MKGGKRRNATGKKAKAGPTAYEKPNRRKRREGGHQLEIAWGCIQGKRWNDQRKGEMCGKAVYLIPAD
jgi:hypothetical protein